MAQCPNCGTQADKFCPNCGAQVAQTPPVAAASVPPQPPTPTRMPAYPQPGQPPQYGTPPQPGYPAPNPYPYQQMPPQKSGSPLKIIGIVAGGLLAIILALFVVLSLGSGPVGTPIITDTVDTETWEPLRELKTITTTTDPIYAAMEVSVTKGQVLSAKWYYNGELVPELNTDLAITEDTEGWAAFNITNGGTTWAPGKVRVEIYLDGELEQSAEFEIK